MVGPSHSDEDRRRAYARLRIGIVALVALSGALTALYADGGPALVVGGALGGAALGAVLAAYLSRLGRQASTGRRPSVGRTDGGARTGSDDRSDPGDDRETSGDRDRPRSRRR